MVNVEQTRDELGLYLTNPHVDKLFRMSQEAINEVVFSAIKKRADSRITAVLELYAVLKANDAGRVRDFVTAAHNRTVLIADLMMLKQCCHKVSILDDLTQRCKRPYAILTEIIKRRGMNFSLSESDLDGVILEIWSGN